MKKIANDKQITMVICNILFLVLLLVIGLSDATSDDYGMQMALYSDKGKFLAFTTVFWSVPLFYLQRIFPLVAWHFTAQVFLIIISLNVYLVACQRVFKGVLGDIISYYFTIVLFQSLIQKFNFTQTSAVICTAGMLVVYFSEEKKRFSLVNKMLGTCMMILGVQLRMEMFFILVAGVLFLGLCFILERKKKWQSEVVIGMIAIAVCLILGICDNKLKETDEQFRFYVAQNDALSNVVDYEVASEESKRVAYEKLGLSKNDISMVQRKSESDPQFFDIELLEDMVAIISREQTIAFHKGNFFSAIKTCTRVLLASEVGFFIYGLIFLSIMIKKGNNKLIPIASIVFIIGFLFIFSVQGRVVERVLVAVELFSIIPILICMCNEPFQMQMSSNAANCLKSAVWILVLIPLIYQISVVNRRSIILDYDTQYFSGQIAADNSHFYAYTKGLDQTYKAVNNLMMTNDYILDHNSFSLNVTPTAPFEKEKFDRYGVTNIYEDAVDSDVIRFILDDDLKQIETYIKEHYCASAKMQLVDTVDGHNIYKVVSK